MTFLISSTFTASLGRLTSAEQKSVKTTVFDLQVNPDSPGLSFHKLDRAKDKGFWSVRASDDIRVIVHRGDGSLLVCYVDHHDKAYAWAERRRIETHPKTGAAQIVEIRERVEESVRLSRIDTAAIPLRPLGRSSDEELLSYGVPLDWLHALKSAGEDELLEIVEHLPAEAAEAVLQLATGGRPSAKAALPALVAAEATPAFGALAPFMHPDAQRRFRVMSSAEELERALDYPWEQWAVFLHPEQRRLVERELSGPFRVSGSAGTGKTVVALHRAAYLARSNPEARVLLATFSEPLAAALRIKLRALLGREPRLGERIDVRSLDALASRLSSGPGGPPPLLGPEAIEAIIREATANAPQPFSSAFIAAEWRDIVDYWGIATQEAYLRVPRLGRKSRLSESQRASLWPLFERIRERISATGALTPAELFRSLAERCSRGPCVYDYVVVDEAQDLGAAQLRFVAALGRHRADGLFFAGDLGQRIFQQPFSWKSLGVDLSGRSATLRINYRTTQQIRVAVDRLLDDELADADGNVERRAGTVSVLSGPMPSVELAPDAAAESRAVGAWIATLLSTGIKAEEIGIFARRAAEFERARAAVESAGLGAIVLDERILLEEGKVAIGTMSLAKGLEFKAVAVMACDQGILPLEERIESLGDDDDLEEAYTTERQLFYVACTRARDWLLVSGVAPGSEFLDDLRAGAR